MKRTKVLKSRNAPSETIHLFVNMAVACLISGLGIATLVQAGSLTPSASPAATSYTLSDIYTRLTTNAASTAGNHAFAPSAGPTGTLRTLSEVYLAIPTIYATSVLSGTTIFGVSGTYNATSLATSTVKSGISFGVGLTGDYPSASNPLATASAVTADLSASGGSITSSNGSVEWWQSSGTQITATLDFPALSNVCDTDTSNNSAGTLTVVSSTIGVSYTYCGVAGIQLKDQFNGPLTAGGFPGGVQAVGGVDDYNNGGAAPSSTYRKLWTACSSGNNYCGTGDSGADAKDESTGLVWSLPCNGSACASFSDSTPLVYSWDSSGGNNGSRTAIQLCSDHSGWFLPTQRQILQGYINGSYGTVEAAGTTRAYWSSTTQSADPTNAYFGRFSTGSGNPAAKTGSNNVRCVR
jgi:hypothetical protein